MMKHSFQFNQTYAFSQCMDSFDDLQLLLDRRKSGFRQQREHW